MYLPRGFYVFPMWDTTKNSTQEEILLHVHRLKYYCKLHINDIYQLLGAHYYRLWKTTLFRPRHIVWTVSQAEWTKFVSAILSTL